jgi:hypothetical protein
LKAPEAIAETCDQGAVGTLDDKADLARRDPAASLAIAPAVHPSMLDVDEIERRLARRPHRPFAQLSGQRPQANYLGAHQSQPASTK